MISGGITDEALVRNSSAVNRAKLEVGGPAAVVAKPAEDNTGAPAERAVQANEAARKNAGFLDRMIKGWSEARKYVIGR